jgi:hypothetical protein
MKAGSITNSPWAKLIVPLACHSSVKPSAGQRVDRRCRRGGHAEGDGAGGTRLDDAALDAWIAEHDFVRFTPWTTIDPVEFRAQVQQARLLEYWHTESSLDPGLRGMSVALLDRKGRCVGAVGSTMPMTAYRDGAHMLEVVLQPLQEAARSIRPLL